MVDGYRTRLVTKDVNEAREVLGRVYCPHGLTVVDGAGDFRAQHIEGTFPGVAVYYLRYGAVVRADTPVFDDLFFLVNQPQRGRYRLASPEGARYLSPGEPVALDGSTPYRMSWLEGCRVLTIRVDRSAVRRVASEIAGPRDAHVVRFPIAQQVSAPAVRRWNGLSRYVTDEVMPAGLAEASPLFRTQLLRLIVTTVFELFPNTLRRDRRGPAGGVQPSAVRRAVALIEEAAGDDIDLADIAAASRLSPRALQEAFRRHLGTTPLACLRDVRMRRAHADLVAASVDDGSSVTEIALRWGFGNLGRFAAEYRRRYGRSPSEVLRS